MQGNKELESFGKFLKELRIKNKFSQRKLAKLTGISFTYLSKIENNKLPPPSELLLKKIATQLNENEDDLILKTNKIPFNYIEIFFRLSIEKQKKILESIRSQQ